MVRNGRVKHYPAVHSERFNNEYREPCVVFTGHPSLRFGDGKFFPANRFFIQCCFAFAVVHFMDLWGKHGKNMVIFTDVSATAACIHALSIIRIMG